MTAADDGQCLWASGWLPSFPVHWVKARKTCLHQSHFQVFAFYSAALNGNQFASEPVDSLHRVSEAKEHVQSNPIQLSKEMWNRSGSPWVPKQHHTDLFATRMLRVWTLTASNVLGKGAQIAGTGSQQVNNFLLMSLDTRTLSECLVLLLQHPSTLNFLVSLAQCPPARDLEA